ncbi:MAG: transaldolase [Anaerolineae bacterium]|nr:MAG: transaldolase [Anaerolineae bacterium]
MNNSQKAHALGQAIWYDNIHRKQIQSGEFGKMINGGLIFGVTSNPSIFNAAIGKSNDYDEQLRQLAAQGLSGADILEQLTITDIQNACDLFLELYKGSDGLDGLVSIEVSPELAYDGEKTAREANRLWELINRPNVMIKIPATQPGLEAIRRSIAAGINVNITLIFSRTRYGEVMEAYLAGLEDRQAAGKPVGHIASVASFFVSRIDSKIDEQLSKLPEVSKTLAGRIAIANAKLAYLDFLGVFSSERFLALEKLGATVQRPLWASTSTKNPAYPDTLYVDNLIGPRTVNTVPPETLEDFTQHGAVVNSLEQGLEDAERALEALEAAGISLNKVTDDLEREGVEKFAQAWSELQSTVETRRSQVLA